MCKCLKDHTNKFKKRLTPGLLIIYAAAKFLFGLALGILLVTYWPTMRWNAVGWGIMLIAILVGLYGAHRVLKK